MKQISAATVAALVLASCGNWVKPGATAEDLRVDENACEQEAEARNHFGYTAMGLGNVWGLTDRCMEAHGWHRDREAATPVASSNGSASESSDRLVNCRLDGKLTYQLRGYCIGHGGEVQ